MWSAVCTCRTWDAFHICKTTRKRPANKTQTFLLTCKILKIPIVMQFINPRFSVGAPRMVTSNDTSLLCVVLDGVNMGFFCLGEIRANLHTRIALRADAVVEDVIIKQENCIGGMIVVRSRASCGGSRCQNCLCARPHHIMQEEGTPRYFYSSVVATAAMLFSMSCRCSCPEGKEEDFLAPWLHVDAAVSIFSRRPHCVLSKLCHVHIPI